MLGVVVDGADDHAARPGRDPRERSAFEIAGIVARFQVFHLAGVAGGDPRREMLEFARVRGRGNAG